MNKPNKIVIVGCTDSGKTTLANKLGSLLHIPVYHLDKIFWIQKGGIKQDVFIAQQEKMMQENAWIIDGNFMRSKSFDMRLSNADTVIFFNFPKIVIFWRLLKRFFQYFNKARPDMGAGQKGTLSWHDIKFIWNYPTTEILNKVLAYSDTKNVVILHSKKEEREFLKKVA